MFYKEYCFIQGCKISRKWLDNIYDLRIEQVYCTVQYSILYVVYLRSNTIREIVVCQLHKIYALPLEGAGNKVLGWGRLEDIKGQFQECFLRIREQ